MLAYSGASVKVSALAVRQSRTRGMSVPGRLGGGMSVRKTAAKFEIKPSREVNAGQALQ